MASLLLEGDEREDRLPDSVLRDLILKSEDAAQDLKPTSKSVAPSPGFCEKTVTDKGEKVFINICKSKEVPSPKDITDEQLHTLLQSGDATNYRVPLSLGEPHAETDKNGKGCTAYDVIISDQFYDVIQSRPTMKNFLLSITMEGLEDKYSIRLSRSSKTLKNRTYFGTSVERQNVREKPKPFIMEVDQSQSKKDEPVKSPEPVYEIVREPADADLPEYLVMEVQLPRVSSSRQLTLDLGEDRVVLSARPHLYHLDIDLPYLINSEDSGAQFNIQTKILTITMVVTADAPY